MTEPAEAKETIVGDSENQYLTFLLEGQTYGIPIVQVHEIRGDVSVTPLPNAPDYILGVLNLRGTIIPVIDLRTRFGLPYRAQDQLSVVIVISIGPRLAGLMVDGVSDVVDVVAEQRRDAPVIEGSTNREFISGLLDIGGRIVIVVDTSSLDDLSGAGLAA